MKEENVLNATPETEEAKVSVYYSIIIPAYNAEKYIGQCIRSVLSQNSNDYELLVIDDGSTDHTGAIAGEMAEQNSSISIVRIPHSGAGAARNEGVRRAKGKYVIFLDADDYWTNPELLGHLREKLHHREADVVMFQMDKYTEDGKLLKKYRKGPFPSDKEFYRLKEVYETLVSDGQVLASSCNKCVRRSLLEDAHIAFQEGGFAEDIDWVLQLFSHVKSISFLDEISYAYRQHRGYSVSNDRQGPEYQARMVQDWAGRLKRHEVENARAVSGLLAFEYGICLGYSQYLSTEMKQMLREHRYLLEYALDRRTRMIRNFHRIFGLQLTCAAVRFYLFLRRI